MIETIFGCQRPLLGGSTEWDQCSEPLWAAEGTLVGFTRRAKGLGATGSSPGRGGSWNRWGGDEELSGPSVRDIPSLSLPGALTCSCMRWSNRSALTSFWFRKFKPKSSSPSKMACISQGKYGLIPDRWRAERPASGGAKLRRGEKWSGLQSHGTQQETD